MTRVDFYILHEDTTQARLQFACRLVAKAHRNGHRVFVAAGDLQQAQALDNLLWAFIPESFIPHALIEETAAAPKDTPVHIGSGDHCGDHSDYLLVLGDTIPSYFSRFGRVSEIVSQHSSVLQVTRQHFKFYRDQGYPIQSHRIQRS